VAERAVVLNIEGLEWSTGAPAPVVLASESRTFVAFERESGDNDLVVTAEFVGCTSVRFGFPNDEALHGHPLWGQGLQFYATHEILESSWLSELRLIESAHENAAATPFANSRHFLLAFHDSILEAIARDVVVQATYPSLSAAVAALAPIVASA
jgi:hypothetical protein